MAVSLRDRRPPPKADTIETRARYAWHDIEGDWRAASPRPAGSRRPSYATASDRNFERVERFFYIGAAALVVVGTAIVVGSAFWGELPQNGDPADSMTPQKIAPPAPRGAPSQAGSGRRPPICDRRNSRLRSSPDRWGRQRRQNAPHRRRTAQNRRRALKRRTLSRHPSRTSNSSRNFSATASRESADRRAAGRKMRRQRRRTSRLNRSRPRPKREPANATSEFRDACSTAASVRSREKAAR